MKKLSLGVELTKNEQKKVHGGGVVCNDGTTNPWVACADGAAYCTPWYQGLSHCF